MQDLIEPAVFNLLNSLRWLGVVQAEERGCCQNLGIFCSDCALLVPSFGVAHVHTNDAATYDAAVQGLL